MRRIHLQQVRQCDTPALLLAYFRPAVKTKLSNDDVERIKGLWEGFAGK